MQQRVPLYFFGPIGRWSAFDNLVPCRFKLDGRWWRSVEHYFQAQKHAPRQYLIERVRKARTGAAAKVVGRAVPKTSARDWKHVKYNVMQRALWAKFTQCKRLRALLLQTGSTELIEDNRDDDLWGGGNDRRGANMMGQALMSVRHNLQKKINQCPVSAPISPLAANTKWRPQ